MAAGPRSDELVVEPRFNGPPASAHGGYISGLIASRLDGPVEVTLRAPPPLARPLTLGRGEGGVVELRDGDVLVAEARSVGVELDPPHAPTLSQAELASSRFPWRHDHPLPSCFGCGTDRAPDDGLRIFCGPDDEQIHAAPWTPARALADDSGGVRPEFVWAALDCPSASPFLVLDGAAGLLLGRLSVRVLAPVTSGDPHVVGAWTLGREGRKLHSASAVWSAEGQVKAWARALWIAPSR